MRIYRLGSLALSCLLVAAAGTSFAQQAVPPHVPQITAALSSSDELLADLKVMVDMAPNAAKAWKALENTLQTFLQGVDKKRPVIVEIGITSSGSEYKVHVPIQGPAATPEKPFLQNLAASGINSKRLAAGFYSLGGVINGFLRALNGYASMAESRNALPAGLANPLVTAKDVLARKSDVTFLVLNPKVATADQQARKADFQKVKDNLQAGQKQRPDSSAEEFELEKALLRHNLEELERFVAESALIAFGWTTDGPKKEAKLDFELKAIPGTSLEASAQQLGKAPGMFYSVPRAKDSILSGRVNFPLDDLRKAHVLETIKLGRPVAAQRINASKTKNDDQKKAYQSAVTIGFDMVEAGVKEGLLDGMIEISQAEGEKVNLVFGLKSANGNELKGIVELLSAINSAYTVKLDIEKLDDVSIHSIQVPESEEFEAIFGKGSLVYVATAPKAWWVAIGEKSLDQLKAAIKAAGQPNGLPATTFMNLAGKAGPWIEMLDARRARVDAKAGEKKPTAEETKAKKERDSLRQTALKAFKQGKDTWETTMEAKNGTVTGTTQFDEGLLRFIGMALAKFSIETLGG